MVGSPLKWIGDLRATPVNQWQHDAMCNRVSRDRVKSFSVISDWHHGTIVTARAVA